MRRLIVNTAIQYLDVPFQHLGRTKRGLDCVGLIVRVAQDLQLSNYDFKAYTREPNKKTFFEAFRNCPDIKRKNIKESLMGDILIISLPSFPCHTAFLGENGIIIHALSSRGKVCQHRLDKYWWNRIVECYEFKGVI